VQWGSTNIGTHLHLWPSNGTPAQIFIIQPDGTIKSSLSDLVIAASGGTEGKSKLTMEENVNGNNQKWIIEKNMIKLKDYKLCFDSP